MKEIIKDFFLKKWQYKLLALLVSVGLWYYVISEQNIREVLTVPVELVNMPENMMLTNKFRNTVDVLIEGRREIITPMNRKDIRVQIDFKEAVEGKNTYIITSKRILFLPNGVEVKDVTPARMTFIFAKPRPKPVETPAEQKGSENGESVR